MYNIPPLYTLLAITLSMMALVFARAIKGSFSFKVFILVGMMFIVCLLLRITINGTGSDVVLDKIIKCGLWILVGVFIQQTIKVLNKPLSVEECAK